MFLDNKLVNLFPVPLWVHVLKPEDAATVNESLLSALDPLRATVAGQGETWQTESGLIDDPAYSPLAGFIQQAAQGVLGYLTVQHKSFETVGLRASITPAGGEPPRRDTRSDNFLGGLYFVKAPAGGNTIVFHDPKPQTNSTVPRYVEPNTHNSRNAHIGAQAGALILFPGWLSYSLEKNEGQDERISLSFDILLKPA